MLFRPACVCVRPDYLGLAERDIAADVTRCASHVAVTYGLPVRWEQRQMRLL